MLPKEGDYQLSLISTSLNLTREPHRHADQIYMMISESKLSATSFAEVET